MTRLKPAVHGKTARSLFPLIVGAASRKQVDPDSDFGLQELPACKFRFGIRVNVGIDFRIAVGGSNVRIPFGIGLIAVPVMPELRFKAVGDIADNVRGAAGSAR